MGGRGLEDKWDFGPLMRQHMDLVKTRPGHGKIVRLLSQWRSIMNRRAEQLVMLEALAKDFFLQPCHFEVLLLNREVAAEVVWRLFSCIEGGEHGRYLVMLATKSLGDYVLTLRKA